MEKPLIDKNPKLDPDARPAPEKLRAAQIQQIYSQSALGGLAAVLGGMVFAAVLYAADPDARIIVWIALYSLTFVSHYLLVRAFARRQPTGEDLLRWGAYHWMVVATGSLAWTYAVIFLFPESFLHLQIFMIIFVGGIVSGAAVIYAPTREYLVSNAVILVPLAGHFLSLGDRYNVTVGLLLFGFGIVMFVMGGRVHRLYSELLQIRFEREDLISGLIQEVAMRQEVENSLRQARDSLEIRVSERTAELQTMNLDLAQEILERRKADNLLRESEKAYRSLSENIPGVVYRIWPGRNEVEFFGRGLEMVTGFRENELNSCGKTALHKLILPEDSDTTARIIDKALALAQPFHLTYRIRHKSGQVIWCSDYGTLIRDDHAQSHIDGAIFDITEQKGAEEAIRRSEQKYRLLFNYAQESIIITRGGSLKFWNAATEDLLGFSSGELADTALSNLIHQDDRELVTDLESERVINLSQGVVRLFRMVSRDGETLWVQSNSIAVEWEGSPSVLTFLTNITELKTAEDLHARMERLRAIGDLASGVAHNFNNLLQVVMAGSEVALAALDKGDSEKIRKALMRIRESSKLGSQTVKRLQRFAKIRRETDTSDKRLLDLSEIVQQSVDITRPLWEANPERQGIRIDMHLDLAEGCCVKGAEGELVEVVINLIKNSVESMPLGGSIRVATAIGKQAELEVEDTGCGIPEDFLEHLFEPYWSTKGAEGTGMGLAVTRQIVESHNGIISVTTQPGRGSVFRINLPLEQTARPEEISSISSSPDLNLKILVIDDTESLVSFLKELLTLHGNEVLSATSGSEGLALFRENDVDLVICDLGMPGITGWEVGMTVAKICEEKGGHKTPFILLTGWGGQSLESSAIVRSRIDAVLEKPIDIGRLLNAIRKVQFREPSLWKNNGTSTVDAGPSSQQHSQ